MRDWNMLAQEAHERHFFHDSVALAKYSGGYGVAKDYRDRLQLNRIFLEGRAIHGDSSSPRVAAGLSKGNDRG